MTCPGQRLRAVCAWLCSARTMERLIDPVLADLQIEYLEAQRLGRAWSARWILIAGYGACLKVMAVHASQQAMRIWSDCPADDRHAFRRASAFAAAAVVAATVLLVLATLGAFQHQRELLVYSIPQGLPIAIPVGVTVGIFWGLSGRVVSRRLTLLVLAAALAWSAVSFTTMVWVLPASGDAFRRAVVERVRLTTGTQIEIEGAKGPIELTFNELEQLADAHRAAGRIAYARNLQFAYHMRWALGCATLALALFAVALLARRSVPRWIAGAAACGACLGYWVLLAAGETVAGQGLAPALTGAWLPNAVFVVASAALRMPARRA